MTMHTVKAALRPHSPEGTRPALLIALDELDSTGALGCLSASQRRSVDRARQELAGIPDTQTANRARGAIRTAIARAALAPVQRDHGVRFKVRKGTGSLRGTMSIRLSDNRSLAVFEAAQSALADAGFVPCFSDDGWGLDLRLAREWGEHHLGIAWCLALTH